jgi:formate hydrogenlyase transcriptional activator
MFIDITGRVLAEQEQARLRAQNLYLQEEIKSVHNFEEIVGRSPALLRALEKVARVAGTDSTVLVTGETGTGKELIARAIHSASRRHERPLIKLNCAALPMGLVESELFGHEKGAFSGALQRRIGRFELANGGTLFLDEVGEMPLDAQVKLLRVLQEGEFERVGGSETHRTDVRIIAATNRDLQRAVSEGAFREDLYYRLNVFPVALPPLRERRGDIPLLVRFFIGKYAARVDRRIEAVEPETIERLVGYRWPGNVRELQNLVERAMILATTPELRIEPEIFVAALPAPSPAVGAAPDLDLDTAQREHILHALKDSCWVVEGGRGAARRLGLHPNTLRSRMKKLGIRRPSSGGAGP